MIRESVELEVNGQKIFGVFHRPKEDKKYPAILICHGLAGTKTGKYRVYVEIANLLAQNGIATLRIDFRGCGDSEGDSSNITLSGEVKDAGESLHFLRTHPFVDPSRIGILGRSFGGPVAVLAAAEKQFIKSIALWVPLFNADPWRNEWELLLNQKPSKNHFDSFARINGQLFSAEFFKELFAMDLSLSLKALNQTPLLYIQAEKDTYIGLKHLDHYKNLRKDSIAKFEVVNFLNSDHEFSDDAERQMAILKTVSWFKETL